MWWHSSVVEIAGVAVLALTLLWPQHPLGIAGAGADDVRLRPGAGDGAVVECGAVERAAGERRPRLRDVWHYRSSRHRRRRRGDRRGIFGLEAAQSARPALFAAQDLFALSIVACAGFLACMRRATN
jgi:hypothetical protein